MHVLKKNYTKEVEEKLFKNLSTYKNEFVRKHKNIEELIIIHSDINTSLDIACGRDIDGNGYSINIADFSFAEIKEMYEDIKKQLRGSINNFKIFLKNGLGNSTNIINNVSDLIRETKNNNLNVYDTYLRDYLQAPNSDDKKINFIYFIRRFSIFKKLIDDTNNDVDDENFLENVFGIHSKEYIDFNNDRILQNVSNLDELFYIFPFLRKIDLIGTLREKYIYVAKKLIDTLPGLKFFEENLYITDMNIVINTILNDSETLCGNTTINYLLKDVSDIFFKIIVIFAYDSILNSAKDIENVTNEDFLISLSLFLFYMYSTNKKYELKKIDNFEDKIKSKIVILTNCDNNHNEQDVDSDYDHNEQDVDNDSIDSCFAEHNFVFLKTIGSSELNNSLFHLYSSNLLCDDIFLNNILKENLLRVGHFFYALKYFKNTLKNFYPLFAFGVFSTKEKKYLVDFDEKKNVFLDQSLDVFNEKYKNINIRVYAT